MPDFHRTNINLHTADADWLKRKYGYGWTEKVRDIIHDYVLDKRQDSDLWPPEPGTDEYEDWKRGL